MHETFPLGVISTLIPLIDILDTFKLSSFFEEKISINLIFELVGHHYRRDQIQRNILGCFLYGDYLSWDQC